MVLPIGLIGAGFLRAAGAVGTATMKVVQKTAKATGWMFKQMKGTAMHAKVMADLFAILDAFLIIVKPFLPFLKILAALIKAFLAPAVQKLVEVLSPFYQRLSDLIPVAMEAGEVLLPLIDGIIWAIENLNNVTLTINLLIFSVQLWNNAVQGITYAITVLSGGALLYFQSQIWLLNGAIVAVTTVAMTFWNWIESVKTVLGEVNAVLESFVDWLGKISGWTSPGGGGGGGGGGDGGDVLSPIKDIVYGHAKGGIITKRTDIAGEAGPEGLIPLDQFWNQFDALREEMMEMRRNQATTNNVLGNILVAIKGESRW